MKIVRHDDRKLSCHKANPNFLMITMALPPMPL
jgi:hypothetical protein